MALQLGRIALDFEQHTTNGRIRSHEWAGDAWVVLFSHPKHHTPVCTTELGEVARLKPGFDRRGIEATQGRRVNVPVLADHDRTVSDPYGVVHPEADPALTVRAVFVPDPAKELRLMLLPPSTGRTFADILRVIDGVQFTAAHEVATPVNRRPGERAIVVPGLSDEGAKLRFHQGWDAQKPHLRHVELPSDTD